MKEIESGNVTMVATEDIAKDEQVAYIPQSMHITSDIAKQTEYYRLRKEAEPEYDNDDKRCLAVFILEQRADPLSTYKDYLDLLPKSYSDHFAMWSEDELEHLKGTEMMKYVKKLPSFQAAYEKAVNLVPDFGLKHSYEQWKEAQMIVNSRNLGDPKGSPHNLVPLIELFNHSNQPDLLWDFEDDQ